MRNYFYLLAFILSGIFLFAISAESQTLIKDYIQKRTLQLQSQRAYAESVAIAKKMPIRVDRENGVSFELQRFENGIPMYYKTDNLNAAKTLSTNKLWPGGVGGFSLTGDNITLGEWDAGKPLTTHQEYSGRIISTQGSLHYHSAHVAGTMIAAGIVPNAHGMSPNAKLKSFDWNNDDVEMLNEALYRGLNASNHSYGIITGWDYDYFGDGRWAWFGDTAISQTEDYHFGFYDGEAQTWDNVAHQAPYYLIVKAAGNDRNEGPAPGTIHWVVVNGSWVLSTKARSRDGRSGGYDCISHSALAKNILTVGAVNGIPGGYTKPSDVVMSSFSCWGPTDDGRIKPDIVGDGINLYSTLESANNAYGTLSGTSMAAPNVTGSVGLLLQEQKILHGSTPILSSTLKAIIINTADEAGSNPGPDYSFGWGLMNTFKAVQLMKQDSIEGYGSHIREMLLHQGEIIRFNIGCNGKDSIQATICWNDPPGNPVAPALNPPDLMLINDLDLRIIKKYDNTIYYPWVLNPSSLSAAATKGDNFRDNIEQVRVFPTQRSVYTVQISHKGTLSGGSQYVSIAIKGNIQPLGPVFYAQSNSGEYSIIPGNQIQDSVKIKNFGDTTLTIHTSILPSAKKWLSTKEDSVNIASFDSTYIHFKADAESLDAWKDFSGMISILHNDTVQAPFGFNVLVNTYGPTITTSKSQIAIDVDSGFVGRDTLWIFNKGYIPLHYSINDTGTTSPIWLTLNKDTGTISVNDSTMIVLTANSPSQNIGDHYTTLVLESNDSKTGIVNLPLVLHVGTRRTLATNISDNWNLMSLPVRPLTNLKSSLFPTAITDAYAYNGNYIVKDTLQFGQGFWMKFSGDQVLSIEGYVVDTETLQLNQGWNIIGSLSNAIPISAVTSNPPGIINSFFFTYDHRYTIADSLNPGKGYWVQINQNGNLILTGSYPSIPKVAVNNILSEMNTLIISDANNNQTLYFGSAELKGLPHNTFNLPPKAPDRSFDARFGSGKFLERITSNTDDKTEYPIHIQTSSHTITVNWNLTSPDGNKYVLRDRTGKQFPLNKTGKLTLENDLSDIIILTLAIEAPKIPKDYALQQNYPNPFNPSTKINYELPSTEYVSIKVYNILGNEITTLVDGVQEAGYHSSTFDGNNLSSGLYFYKIKTDKFTSTKKMILMR